MTHCDGCNLDDLDLPEHVDPAAVFTATSDGTFCTDCTRPAPCDCYDTASMEYGQNHPCPACRARDTERTP